MRNALLQISARRIFWLAVLVTGCASLLHGQVSPIFPSRAVTDADMWVSSDTCSMKLVYPLGPADTTIQVQTAVGCPTANFLVKIEKEVIGISSVSGVVLSVSTSGRGYGGTTAAGHARGQLVTMGYFSYQQNRDAAEIEALEAFLMAGPTTTLWGHILGSLTDQGDLVSALGGKQATLAAYSTISALTGYPSTFPPTTTGLALLGAIESFTAKQSFTGGVDASGSTHTLPTVVVASVGSLPSSGCTAGELAVVTGATIGQQIYENSTTGSCTWTQQSGGSGGASTGFNQAITPVAGAVTLTCPSQSGGIFQVDTLGANVTSASFSGCPGSASVSATFIINYTEPVGAYYSVVWPTGCTSLGQPAPAYNGTATTTSFEVGYDGTTCWIPNSANQGPGTIPEAAAPGVPSQPGTVTPWADATSHMPRWEDSAGTIYQGSIELAIHGLRSSQGANAPDAVIGPDASTTKFLASAGVSADPTFRVIAQADLPNSTRPFSFVVPGSGTAGAMQGTDDFAHVWRNGFGATFTITGITCITTGSGTTRIQITEDGHNVLADNTGAGLDCTSTEAAGALSGTYYTVASTKYIGYTTVTAGIGNTDVMVMVVGTVPVI
jgi:hypothetical protein